MANPRRLIREPERKAITGVPRATWYVLMREGKAPKPVPLTSCTVAWPEDELYGWVEAQIEKREAGAA